MTKTSAWRELCDRIYAGVDPYEGFNALRFRPDHQGWNSDHVYLSEVIATVKPRVVVEIGVWKGGSSIRMAEAMRSARCDGVIVSVDTWLGSWDHYDRPDFFPSLLMQNGYPSLFYTFLTNVIDKNVAEYILPLPLDSANAAIVLEGKAISAEVVHIDAAHDFESTMSDLRRWWKVLSPRGVMIVDDYDLEGVYWPSVRDAVHSFLGSTPHEAFEALPYKARFRKPAS